MRRDKEKANKLFEAAIKAHPRHVSVLVKFAAMKKGSGDLDGAEALYRRAVTLARADDGDPAGALAVFLHAVRQDAAGAQDM